MIKCFFSIIDSQFSIRPLGTVKFHEDSLRALLTAHLRVQCGQESPELGEHAASVSYRGAGEPPDVAEVKVVVFSCG